MPKGDRLRLKADPEDGTTPIANLLLEAVAMAKISGLQKGAILYLWRRTYGWVEDGKRLKERKIGLTEWVNALDGEKSNVSKALTELEKKGIMKRRTADSWGGYYYSINTNISKWNSNSINLAKLADTVTVVKYATIGDIATVGENSTMEDKPTVATLDNATVGENSTQQLAKIQLPTLYKEILNKDKERGDENKSSPPLDKITTKLSNPQGIQVREVFARIDKIRGYRPPKRKAEAASILRMIKHYTPDQIIETWESLKKEVFWQNKELFIMTIESQIGALLNGTNRASNQAVRNSEGNLGEDKFTKQKYAGIVRK